MQNELVAQHQFQHTPLPLAPPPMSTHCSPTDSSILEWLLRSNNAEEGPWSKLATEPQMPTNAIVPYLENTDEPHPGVDADLTPAFVPAPVSTTGTTPADTRTSDTTTTPSLPFNI
ncbi:hypothetical protein P3T76_015492 [Phytophthora citrophthora]|uniref:Uncharacterized protein n=1 Tax=Phytophthora citrophthora TaxID=4793 RepID=A0AAD9G024_9STRA|nr:hypothetical protein P3T76_015492 [Phytophthora citrophthora]